MLRRGGHIWPQSITLLRARLRRLTHQIRLAQSTRAPPAREDPASDSGAHQRRMIDMQPCRRQPSHTNETRAASRPSSYAVENRPLDASTVAQHQRGASRFVWAGDINVAHLLGQPEQDVYTSWPSASSCGPDEGISAIRLQNGKLRTQDAEFQAVPLPSGVLKDRNLCCDSYEEPIRFGGADVDGRKSPTLQPRQVLPSERSDPGGTNPCGRATWPIENAVCAEADLADLNTGFLHAGRRSICWWR
jgi:hypothetical protein